MNLNKKRIVGISLFFVLGSISNIFPVLMSSNNINTSTNGINLKDNEEDTLSPKLSYSYIETTTQTIDNDWSSHLIKGWLTGAGVPSNPYIIEGLIIDVSGVGSALEIKNSNGIAFEVRNCKFTNAQGGLSFAGLVLENTNGGKFLNCNISSNGYYGAMLINSDNNEFDDCIFQDMDSVTNTVGVILSDGSDNNKIINSYFKNNEFSIAIGYLGDSTPSLGNLIENNDFIESATKTLTSSAIRTLYTGCDHTIIRNNRLNDLASTGSIYGIYLDDADGCIIAKNTIRGFTEVGLKTEDSDNLLISENTISDNEGQGINSKNGLNMIITDNSIKNNTLEGIYLNGCLNVSIDNNIIRDNGNKGLYLINCGYNCGDPSQVSNNQINGHITDNGLDIENSNGIMISNNELNGNRRGANIQGTGIESVQFINNIIRNSTSWGGVRLYTLSLAVALGNLIQNTISSYGLYVGISDYALISYNTIENSINGDGIQISHCDYATISDNAITDIADDGLFFWSSSSNCLISGNLIQNIGDNAIEIDGNYNKISKNIIHTADIGIFLNSDEYNLIDGNIISNCNENGVYIQATINSNTISNNQFLSNENGVLLDTNADNNVITYNSFVLNNHTIFDEGTSNIIRLNYYDNYNGTDNNGDGIGDDPINIGGTASNKDLYPLMNDPNIETEDEDSDDGIEDKDDNKKDREDEESAVSMDWVIWILVIGMVGGGVAIVGYLYQTNKTRNIIIPNR